MMMDLSSVIDGTLTLLGAAAALMAGLCTILDQSTTVSTTPSVDETESLEPDALPKAA
jgi:hypothetical protein